MNPTSATAGQRRRHFWMSSTVWTKRFILLAILVGIYLVNFRILLLHTTTSTTTTTTATNGNEDDNSSTSSHSVERPSLEEKNFVDSPTTTANIVAKANNNNARAKNMEQKQHSKKTQQQQTILEMAGENRLSKAASLSSLGHYSQDLSLQLPPVIGEETNNNNNNNNNSATKKTSPVNNTKKRPPMKIERYYKKKKTNTKKQNANASSSDQLVRLNQHLRYDNITLQIPTPVFLASLPKSGTTSIWKYFSCGGVKASHLYVKLNETEAQRFDNGASNSTFSGRCMHANVLSNRPLLENCGQYQVWTDTGYIKGKPAVHCYYPAIEGLDELYKWYPNATLLYITRDTEDWTQSVSRWSMGTLLKRWKRCNLTGFINKTVVGMNAFYDWHKALVRNFAKNHPSLTYIEAALEDPETGFILQDATGIPASCWADCDPHTRQCRTLR